MVLKTISDFDCSPISTNSSNTVQICKDKLDNRNWYTKSYDNTLYSLNHLLAKNFYNLFTPFNHEALLIQSDNDKLLAISEIQTYTHIDNISCYNTGAYYNGVLLTHLLESIIIALLIDDWDVIGNIGCLKVDRNTYGIKIDFDESFLRVLEHNVTFQTFFKPIGSMIKNCHYKALIIDTIKSVLEKFSYSVNALLLQCIQDTKSSFVDAEIYDLSVAIQTDSWYNGFFKHHPIQSVTSNDAAIQQLCESIMTSIENRKKGLEGMTQQLYTMTDAEYAYAIACLSADNGTPYAEYSSYITEKQNYVHHEDL